MALVTESWTQFLDLHTRLVELKTAYREAAKAAFEEGAQALFLQHPTLKSFGWRQYTPYFNDGDTCEFSAHTDYPEVNNEDLEDSNHFRWNDPDSAFSEELQMTKEEHKELIQVVVRFLRHFEEEILKDLFGDHARVIITPSGASVEEYEHD
jgi:hypothetical protein